MQVWEVTAQLMGLAASVVVLRAIEANGEPKDVLWVWLIVQVCIHTVLAITFLTHSQKPCMLTRLIVLLQWQVVHVALRYISLDFLQFAEINQKRSCILVAAHVRGDPVPSEPPAQLSPQLP